MGIAMTFSSGDVDRIMGHLGYPVDEFHQKYIMDACNKVSAVGGIPAEIRVIRYLNDLDAAHSGSVSEAGRGTLKKAETAEWVVDIKAGGRSAGYFTMIKRLQKLLADTLGIKKFSEMRYIDIESSGNQLDVC
jgi:hypothetical protein